ncbi:SgcJ/EcaC family oxidoreductase [Sphingomonas sp. LHG3406-1]|uniref:SgcJ/EcaC family oxidoreductase n=1 Tax=Sphingomonas sp. LHG3406-1 TaxID=2804617 RepID=UPI0026115AF4|nr:SgcJ/EcaC family oxidoreductase [Sphingomonas sp. LHG3406-1]
MKLTFLAIAAFAAATGPALASNASVPGCAAASRIEIEGQIDRFAGALKTNDPDKVTALFAADAVLLPTLSNTLRTNPSEVRDYFVHFLAKSPVVRVDSSTVRIGCNMAERVGTWTWTLTDPKSGAKSQAAARYSFIYRHEGGQWRIDHLHSSLMPEPVTKTAAAH